MMVVLLKTFFEKGRKRTFELADEDVGKSKAVDLLEPEMAAGMAKGLEPGLEKSRAEEMKEDSAHHRLEATRELAHPLEQSLKEEVVAGFGALIDASDGRLALGDVS